MSLLDPVALRAAFEECDPMPEDMPERMLERLARQRRLECGQDEASPKRGTIKTVAECEHCGERLIHGPRGAWRHELTRAIACR